MFAHKLFIRRFTGLYTYPCTKLTFLLPCNCSASIRKLSSRKLAGVSYGLKSSKVCQNSPKSYTKLQARRKPFKPRNFATEYTTTTTAAPKVSSTFQNRIPQGEPQAITPLDGLREFFSHPLTWDRNNGYMNILLGLAIFGYSFCTSCSCDTKISDTSNEMKK